MSINDEQQQQQHQWCEVDGDSVINQLRIWKLIVEGIQPPRHVLKRVIEQSIPVNGSTLHDSMYLPSS